MSLFKTIIVIAPLALSSAALAGPAHMSDAQYIAASRCAGLMSASALGRQDSRDLEAVLRSEGASRTEAVIDRATEARDDASRAASHAGTFAKASLIAERDGACRAVVGGGVQSAAASPAQASRTN